MNEDLELQAAKAKFRASMSAADPVNIIKKNPMSAVSLALTAGLGATTFGYRIIKMIAPGVALVSSLLKVKKN